MATVYTLPKLPFEFHELEPIMSAEVIQLHYEKHHAGYVKNLNDALQRYEQTDDLSQKIVLGDAIKFHGGGHVNHSLFWENLTLPSKSSQPGTGPLYEALVSTFGSVSRCQELVTSACGSVQGSGWGWLGYCRMEQRLFIETTQNHDLLLTKRRLPLLCIDVWEHAYYLQYKNMRADYVTSIWKIIDWKIVEKRFLEAKSV